MVTSPSVLSKTKKAALPGSTAKKPSSVSWADIAGAKPIASTSKARVALPEAEMDGADETAERGGNTNDDEEEGDGEWQGIADSTSSGSSRETVGHPGIADKAAASNTATANEEEDDAIMIDPNTLLPTSSSAALETGTGADQGLLKFPALSAKDMQGKAETQSRKISIPPHRMTPLKRDWLKIYSPLVDECGLMVRMNVNKKNIEMKTSKHTPAPANTVLQRAVDFVAAYGLGFSAEDAIALLRMEDLFVETFEVRDVKTLHGDHLSRAIGRIAGKDGKTRFTIENVSRTRIVLADQKIHILGTFSSIKVARDAVCALILGSPPGKVYNNLRTVAARQRQRF